MVAASIMTTEADYLTAGSTILDAFRMLRDENVRQVPVVDEGSRVIGVITQRRLMRAVFEESFQDSAENRGEAGGVGPEEGEGGERGGRGGRGESAGTGEGARSLPRFIGSMDSLSRASVSPALERDFASVRPEASLFEVAEIFHKNASIGGILVVDNEKRLLGVISHRDVFRRLCEYLETKREKRG